MNMFIFSAWLVSIPDYLSGAWGPPNLWVIILYSGITCYVYATIFMHNKREYGMSLRTRVEAIAPILATVALLIGFYMNLVFLRFAVPIMLMILGYIFEIRTSHEDNFMPI